ncbi:efflux RND transporter periplasmic adaptor subunit [Ancylobacter sp. MQZ15Z-1]|uniref:Efflux RND transporter periplasmic adaptor subunit n=1 Tax=Ancylobacter mangrovi TaxID=2972472 RepID=A0A9X2PBB5_9HYPH|nr:efflux RND transporter periplasmic adaptor subunit [Ancylobacter mangrovi]MCS0493756.1 efflux RND transporter periplasmic adaptor subunit [Ancylobacter mangrovi]
MSTPRMRPALVAAACLAFLVLGGCDGRETSGQQQGGGQQRPQVGVVTVHPQSVAITAELPGRTTASLVAEVRPQVAGIIKERLFQEGSEVKAGDPLYQIDPASYQASYDSAVASLQKAEALVPSAQSKVDRYQNLIKQNAVSKQDYDDAVASLAQAKADVAVNRAAVDTARINLDFTRITAPISGRIDKSSLTPGALVTASQDTALTTIRTLDPINVDVTQSSTNLLNLRQAIRDGRIKISGDNVQVRLKLDNGTLYSHAGTLEFSSANVDETTGTYLVRARFPNPDRLLLPGMYVHAIVEEGVAPNSFLVPQRGVTRNTKGEPVALVVDADDKVEQRVLTISRNVGNSWLVESGVADGDRVIVEGSQFAKPGLQVTPVSVVVDDTTGEVSDRGQRSTAAPAKEEAAKKEAAGGGATAGGAAGTSTSAEN